MHKVNETIEPSENKSWPPELNRYIMVQITQPNGNVYFGKVLKILQNNVGIIISLIKGCDYPFPNNEVKPYIKASSDPKRFMLVIETHGWRYIAKEKIHVLLKQFRSEERRVG